MQESYVNKVIIFDEGTGCIPAGSVCFCNTTAPASLRRGSVAYKCTVPSASPACHAAGRRGQPRVRRAQPPLDKKDSALSRSLQSTHELPAA